MPKTKIFSALMVIALLATAASAQPVTMTLTTTFAGGNGQSGNMFDIVATNPNGIEITSFDVNVDAVGLTIEVYTLFGSFLGNENNPAAWGAPVETFNVMGLGQNVPTPLPAFTLGGGANGGINILPGATQAFYVTINTATPPVMWYTNGSAVGAVFASNADLQFLEGAGIAFPFTSNFTPRVWNGRILYTIPSAPVAPEFDTNSLTASMDISGVIGSGFQPAVLNSQFVICPGVPPSPVADVLNMSVSGNPGAAQEIATSLANVVPASAGGVLLPGGEILNLDPFLGISFLNGGSTLQLLPLLTFPGATGGSFSVPFQTSGASLMSIQAVITNPSVPSGFELTQPTQRNVSAVGPPSSLAGPTGDDEVKTRDISASPICWVPGGWALYGTLHNLKHQDSNGQLAGGPNPMPPSDFTPTVAEALSGHPTVFPLWTDLSPNVSGQIINNLNPATGVISFNWMQVPYFGQPGSSNTISVEYDPATQIISIIGLAGVSPNPSSDVIIGITPGGLGGATDPGIVNGGLGFISGSTGIALGGTDMLYDLGTGGLLPASINGALNRIDFIPTLIGVVPNYVWVGS